MKESIVSYLENLARRLQGQEPGLPGTSSQNQKPWAQLQCTKQAKNLAEVLES